MIPNNGNLSVQDDHEDDDNGTIEVVVEREFPAVHLHIR